MPSLADTMSKRRDAKRDAHQANLFKGSLYLPENMDFITKTKELAEVIHKHLSNDPDYKANPLRLEIATLYRNLWNLELKMQMKLRRQVRIEKRKLGAMEDGWMFGDEHAVKYAIQAIACEDAISADR